MTAPRVELQLDLVEANTRTMVDRLAARGIGVVAVTKAALGAPGVAGALLRGGASGLADSRVENLERLRAAAVPGPTMLLRSPMLSQVDRIVAHADVSLDSEPAVLDALAGAATAQHRTHGVILMVELGDLREGVPVDDVVGLARHADRQPGLRLDGIGTNLACQCGVVPDQRNMDQLTELAGRVELALGRALSVVSGGNSANLAWALATDDVGRIDQLRLGEALLLGTEPSGRQPIEGLRTDGCTLHAEVIEVQDKPARPWGHVAQAAHGVARSRPGAGTIRQALVAVGRQDTDPDDLTPPDGIAILGASSDHLVLDAGDHPIAVGDELAFTPGYGALVRAMTSPHVMKLELAGAPSGRSSVH